MIVEASNSGAFGRDKNHQIITNMACLHVRFVCKGKIGLTRGGEGGGQAGFCSQFGFFLTTLDGRVAFSPFYTKVEWLLSLHFALGWNGCPEYEMCAITKVQE